MRFVGVRLIEVSVMVPLTSLFLGIMKFCALDPIANLYDEEKVESYERVREKSVTSLTCAGDIMSANVIVVYWEYPFA
jgi:hypothetical protein